MTNPIISLGIDLGTTYSLCAVLQDGVPTLLPNALAETLTPSAVSVDAQGRVLVGDAARARASTHPQHTALTFKRDMGTDRVFTLGSQPFRAEELSALVLSELRRDAEAALGHPVERAVITVPAYFGERQRAATRLAGELAGLRVDRIINEPTAAALAYGLQDRGRELRAIVLDLGGGTFDVTVLEIADGVIEVQASAGDARLGGEDFVDPLAQALRQELQQVHAALFDEEGRLAARLRETAERVKRQLSTDMSARAVFPQLPTSKGLRDIELTIQRALTDQLWQPLLDRLKQPIARALRDAGLTPDQLDEVLLVGGASRMPCFVELVAKMFSRMPSRSLPADEAVALGAAVQAALCDRMQAVADLVVTDVAPFSLGVAAASKLGGRQVEGLFVPIIERGTTIPVSRVEQLCTLMDGQREILVEVYQGEHAHCRDNLKLGECRVGGLPSKPAGEVSIDIRFTYDPNGLLEVDSRVVGTDKAKSIVIEQRPGALSRREVAAALKRMKQLKFHPRESLPNRTAMSRAEALYPELRGESRAVLTAAIAQLEAALRGQLLEEIESAREQLVALTGRLGQHRAL